MHWSDKHQRFVSDDPHEEAELRRKRRLGRPPRKRVNPNIVIAVALAFSAYIVVGVTIIAYQINWH